MVDSNIKKTRILKSSLPPIDHDTEKYNIRYRIISEDRNRTSHWSPIYNSDGVDLVVTSGAVSRAGNVITAVWGDQNDFPEYDVFVKFDSGDFFYHGKSKVHSYSFLKTGTTSVRVKVQIISSKKEIKAALNIFDSGTVSLV
jgi:uncharacterized protein (DUF2141 family)